MFRTFRLGRLFGIPIELNLSFLLLVAGFVLFAGGLATLPLLTLLFASVIVHELAHALVARHLGVPIAGIELHFFGGAAKMGAQPRTPGDEIAIAAAGPAMSFTIAGLAAGAASLIASPTLVLLAQLNLVLAVFNLIPALPMDGGRILRALLERRMGHYRATRASVSIARVFAVLFGVVGVATGTFMLPILAVVLWTMGTAELQLAAARGRGGGGHRGDGVYVAEPIPRGFAGDDDDFDARPRQGQIVVDPRTGRIWIVRGRF